MNKAFLRRSYHLFGSFLFDPLLLLNKWRGLPYFARNAWTYRGLNQAPSFRLRASDVTYTSYERFLAAGSAQGHYFFQDLWAARHLAERQVREHVDVGSRLDGFVAHVLPFARVRYVDIRPLSVTVPGLEFLQGSLLEMPFDASSVSSLSCLHVIEHVGLGRYGDPVDPEGHRKAASELVRVLAPGGTLLLGTPVGRERLAFDAHRVFDPQTVVDIFAGLELREFSLIDDAGQGIISGADFDAARRCEYGCGLFVFTKEQEAEQ